MAKRLKHVYPNPEALAHAFMYQEDTRDLKTSTRNASSVDGRVFYSYNKIIGIKLKSETEPDKKYFLLNNRNVSQQTNNAIWSLHNAIDKNLWKVIEAEIDFSWNYGSTGYYRLSAYVDYSIETLPVEWLKSNIEINFKQFKKALLIKENVATGPRALNSASRRYFSDICDLLKTFKWSAAKLFAELVETNNKRMEYIYMQFPEFLLLLKEWLIQIAKLHNIELKEKEDWLNLFDLDFYPNQYHKQKEIYLLFIEILGKERVYSTNSGEVTLGWVACNIEKVKELEKRHLEWLPIEAERKKVREATKEERERKRREIQNYKWRLKQKEEAKETLDKLNQFKLFIKDPNVIPQYNQWFNNEISREEFTKVGLFTTHRARLKKDLNCYKIETSNYVTFELSAADILKMKVLWEEIKKAVNKFKETKEDLYVQLNNTINNYTVYSFKLFTTHPAYNFSGYLYIPLKIPCLTIGCHNIPYYDLYLIAKKLEFDVSDVEEPSYCFLDFNPDLEETIDKFIETRIKPIIEEVLIDPEKTDY